MLYIRYMAAGEEVRCGPYLSLMPDGTGLVIGQCWTAYKATGASGNISRIIIPTKYHSIICC